MESKAPTSYEQIAIEGDQKNGIMAILSTAYDTQISKVHEPDVGQGIDNFSNVEGCIVVLNLIQHLPIPRRWIKPTSSHQFKVEVIGCQ